MSDGLGYDYQKYLVEDPTKLPKTKHNIVIVYETVHESDGYGGSYSKQCARIYVFLDDAEWESAIAAFALAERRPHEKAKFIAYKHVAAANVMVKAHVSVE